MSTILLWIECWCSLQISMLLSPYLPPSSPSTKSFCLSHHSYWRLFYSKRSWEIQVFDEAICRAPKEAQTLRTDLRRGLWGEERVGDMERVTWKHTLLLLSRFSPVQLCATPQTAAHQAPLSLGFSRQEHWSGLPFLLQETYTTICKIYSQWKLAVWLREHKPGLDNNLEGWDGEGGGRDGCPSGRGHG